MTGLDGHLARTTPRSAPARFARHREPTCRSLYHTDPGGTVP